MGILRFSQILFLPTFINNCG